MSTNGSRSRVRHSGVKIIGLLLLTISIGCGTKNTVRWPEPEIRQRPPVNFFDSAPNGICLTVEDQRALMDYIILTELELLKARATLEIINQR